MTKGTSMAELPRRELARRYAHGEMSIHEVRRAGHWRMIELLADLAIIGARPPVADMKGPNVETRLAGLARLGEVLRP